MSHVCLDPGFTSAFVKMLAAGAEGKDRDSRYIAESVAGAVGLDEEGRVGGVCIVGSGAKSSKEGDEAGKCLLGAVHHTSPESEVLQQVQTCIRTAQSRKTSGFSEEDREEIASKARHFDGRTQSIINELAAGRNPF